MIWRIIIMKKILFVIDMQKDFIDGSLGSKDAQKIIPNVVNLINNFEHHQQIIFTLDTHYENSNVEDKPNYENTLEGKLLPVKHCIEGTEGYKLNAKVSNAIQNYCGTFKGYIKNTFGSLKMVNDTSLYVWDNIKSTDELFVCGLCSDICVISTCLLLRAQFPNLNITCYEDCCAGTSKKAHNAAMLIMKSNQINVEKFNKEN